MSLLFLLVAALVILPSVLVLAAGAVWLARRGDRTMGVGDTQGRDDEDPEL